jgi:REP element-mobilizing transposase RayT
MSYDPRVHHRKSIRLKGFDYSAPGSYYVTICAAKHRRIFGMIRNEHLIHSDIGKIVDADWQRLTEHYPNIVLDEYQLMPNHLHAIVTFTETARRHMALSPLLGAKKPSSPERKFGNPIAGSLSTIIGAYKSGVTIKARKAGLIHSEPLWQSRFYDHVIRSDTDFFMIQQYIKLNPTMWEYDIDNPDAPAISFEEFEKRLEEKYGITGTALYIIVNSKKFNRLRLL